MSGINGFCVLLVVFSFLMSPTIQDSTLTYLQAFDDTRSSSLAPTIIGRDLPLIFTPNRGQWSDSLLFRAGFVGANANSTVVGLEATGSRTSFYLGNTPGRWRTNIPTYQAICYQDIYPGIDLKYCEDRRSCRP